MLAGVLSAVLFTVLASLPCSASPNSSLTPQPVNSGLNAVYVMSKTFLEKVVQPRYLTEFIDESFDVDTALQYIDKNRNKVINYIGGIATCTIIGILIAAAMLVVAVVFPCCRCCGRCGVRQPSVTDRKSHCCITAMQVTLGVVTFAIFLANLEMYGTNERLHDQTGRDVYVQLDLGFDRTDEFLGGVLPQYDETVVGAILELQGSLMSKIDGVSADLLLEIDNMTNAVTTLRNLSKFADDLGTLRSLLSDSSRLTTTLATRTDEMLSNWTSLRSEIDRKLAACSSSQDCQSMRNDLNRTQAPLNFSSVALSEASQNVDTSTIDRLRQLVNSTISELDNVEQSVNSSLSSARNKVKDECQNVRRQVDSVMTNIDGKVNDSRKIISDVRSQIASYKSTIQRASSGLYAVMLIFSIVISLVIVANAVGLVLGLVLKRSLRPRSCRSDQSLGAHFLMTSVGLTLVFYWLFSLLTALLFFIGGVAHTEACRHLINKDDPRSVAVLGRLDHLINKTANVQPFAMYRKCGEDGVTLFTALGFDKRYNLTSLINSAPLQTAIGELNKTSFHVPRVNFTNSNLTEILTRLGHALDPRSLNFPGMYNDTAGHALEPPLEGIISNLTKLNSTIVNLSSEISALNKLLNDTQSIERDRDTLVAQLSRINNIVSTINLTDASSILMTSQDIINGNASVIVSAFVTKLAVGIYDDVMRRATRVATAIQSEIVPCRPFNDVIEYVVDMVCVQTIYPINGYWFALGWNMAFLVPSLVLGVQLATVFRYRDYFDYDDNSDSQPMDRIHKHDGYE